MSDLSLLEPIQTDARQMRPQIPVRPAPVRKAGRPSSNGVTRLFSIVGRKCLSLLRRYQHAKMTTVMHELSDKQLAAIGITRAQIPDYVRGLTHGK